MGIAKGTLHAWLARTYTGVVANIDNLAVDMQHKDARAQADGAHP
ncbi:hypothetical protein [Gluconobacter cerinus]|nr:hypothetical protein [Gluconobacter cerinus]MCW2266728.1 hypothetical protein [Gluconobacter cerinus]